MLSSAGSISASGAERNVSRVWSTVFLLVRSALATRIPSGLRVLGFKRCFGWETAAVAEPSHENTRHMSHGPGKRI